MNWIETETKKETRATSDRAEKGKMKRFRKRWNKIFVDDVSIVYCNAPNVKWRKKELTLRTDGEREGKEEQERLLFNKRKKAEIKL